jgi:hypothetical protein
MTQIQQQLLKLNLKPSQPAANDISRNDAKIEKPKWMRKAEAKFQN